MAVQLKRSRLFEQVVDILEQRIRDRKLVAGAELPSERQLMAEFGVGRTAIREALFHLQRVGLSISGRVRGHGSQPRMLKLS
jgi:DNA-binding FadR family transcriptional regulator